MIINETERFESECKRYRYLLRRDISGGDGICTFILLNPSTADATKDDPTSRRCANFARDWGYGTMLMVNLFAYRATNPKDLINIKDYHLAVGVGNDEFITEVVKISDKVILS
jgi:hypothetical protein